VSHELRTPLTVLKGYLETLQQMDDGQSTIHARSLDAMLTQTERMQSLIDDLLLLARLESKEKKSECVNVPELLTQICEESDSLKNAKSRIELHLDSEAFIQGDPQELRSAFSNLIINALKYSPDDARVKVHWQPHGDGGMSFVVIDRGEGIAHHEIPRLTERFYRVEVKRHHKINGTGLGLAIVKHVLARHDAKLEIHSELGKGSCFRCVFPPKRLCASSSST
jgi:two-component system phosphate regulon sensor histidine kinase PhoR